MIASKQTANIKVEENEAYATTEQYRKHILLRVERNPAYEMTCTVTKNTATNRAHSPQA